VVRAGVVKEALSALCALPRRPPAGRRAFTAT
jgi:hypothetical protein